MKNKSHLAGLIDWVWRQPKSKVCGKIRQVCDDMPHRQRLMVVTVLLSAFVLIAFFVFGHACYRMGAKRAVFEYEVEHLHELEIPESKLSEYPEEGELPLKQEYCKQTDSAYDDTGVEIED